MRVAQVAVFAKAPIPGFAKTRLIPLLGPEGAAGCHAQMVRRALTIASASGATPSLWRAGDAAHPFWAEMGDSFGCPQYPQTGDDLGARMAHALCALHHHQHPVVLIGSDCPALTADHLRSAVAALAAHDHVFVPAEDGGYVLVGTRRPDPALFSAIDWGTDRVMAQTRARLRALGCDACELPMLWDLDDAADWHRARAEGLID